MLRGGISEIVEPFYQVKNILQPYLVPIVDIVKNAIPQVRDPANSYWLYQGELPSFRGAVVGGADILSTIHPNYLLVAATFVFVFFVLYIKMQYPFWNQIPALHVYDWHRRYFYSEKPYIVHVIPKKTKYYESRLVKTERFQDLEESRKTEIAKLLQNYYLPSDRVFCSLKVPELAAQCKNAIISTWNQIENDISLNTYERTVAIQSSMNIQKIEGFITSRKINTSISLGSSDSRYIVQESANYIDYLCFNARTTRASSLQNIRKLFQTHEYNARVAKNFGLRRSPDLQSPALEDSPKALSTHVLDRMSNITLFKKEVELCEAIVPLVEYETLTFYLRFKIDPKPLPTNFQLVRIQRENLRHLHDWMERVASLKEDIGFRVSITAEIGDLIHLLQTNQMFAYVLRGPDTEIKTKLDVVYAIYFFRDAHMKYDDLDGGDTLHATAAFCNTDDFELYFLGFVWAVKTARKDLSGTETKMLMVDDLGHLRGVAARWKQTHDIILQTKCAYYFCNYVVPRSPFRAEAANILV